MCLSVPGKVLELVESTPGMARVEIAGVVRDVNLLLLPDGAVAEPGAWVLVNAGFALDFIEESEALELLGMLEELTRPPDEMSSVSLREGIES